MHDYVIMIKLIIVYLLLLWSAKKPGIQEKNYSTNYRIVKSAVNKLLISSQNNFYSRIKSNGYILQMLINNTN